MGVAGWGVAASHHPGFTMPDGISGPLTGALAFGVIADTLTLLARLDNLTH